MQFTLLMVAAAIALAGAIFHGIVGGRIYMKNIRESQVGTVNTVTELSVLADVYRLITGERHHVYGGGLAASLGFNGRASDRG
jgi:hypothetical protein